MADQTISQPHVLDDPPPYHYKLLDYGERPYWSPDGGSSENEGSSCKSEGS